jgi:hypothetical protein
MRTFDVTKAANMKQDRRVRSGIERRRPDNRFAYPAPFVTQVMSEHAANGDAPKLVRPPRNNAVEAYRAGARISLRRAPAGLGHSADI